MLNTLWRKGGGSAVYRTALVWGLFVWGGMLVQNYRIGVLKPAVEQGMGWTGLVLLFLGFNLANSCAVVLANGYWFEPQQFGGPQARGPVLAGLFHLFVALTTCTAVLAILRAASGS